MHNEFKYDLFLFYLDLDETGDLFANSWLLSNERRNLAYFRRKDHLGDPKIPLKEAVKDLVEKETGIRPQGPIRLLTHLRYMGYCFNPLSVYYCYDRLDRDIETIVAEVHNTPWGEEHCYVLENKVDQHPSSQWKQFQFDKGFHVSPFMPLDMKYDWRCSVPGATLQIHINSSKNSKKVFDATLSLRSLQISSKALTRLLITRPPMTYKVITKIYWQALRLWWKGAPYFPHPGTLATDSEKGKA